MNDIELNNCEFGGVFFLAFKYNLEDSEDDNQRRLRIYCYVKHHF